MKKASCSRNLPKPIKIFASRKSRCKDRLVYIVYPHLGRFRVACQKCKYRCEIKTPAGRKSICRLKDKDFRLKYYNLSDDIRVWIGATPPKLRTRNNELCQEVEAWIEESKVRSFRLRESSRLKEKGCQIKPEVTAGIDSLLCTLESKCDRSGGVV